VELLESSLEFGAYLALDIAGIARGQAYLMAGMYFRRRADEDIYIESYVICGGSLSIIGLIQVSIVFYLGMSYQSGALRGRASVEVSIKVLFFSASYSLTFEKQITGNQGLSTSMAVPAGSRIGAWYASRDSGPSADSEAEILIDDELYADQQIPPYQYLYVPSSKAYIPVYDPTFLYEHEMDFDQYTSQFSN
jgi:hypothetical protein